MISKKDQKTKELSCYDVADYFLAFANEIGAVITNLKLQKLVYYSQAWHLANYKDPLFKEDFQAWVHGPVIPDLYQTFKEKGSMPIIKKLKIKKIENRFDKDSLSFIKEVLKVYMPFGAYQLEMMTHQESPWIKARKNLKSDEICQNTISKISMQKYYGEKI